MNRNALIVLEALMMGIPVELGGYEYTMINGCMTIPMYNEHGDRLEERFWNSEMPLSVFISYCERLTEDEVIKIALNVGLNKEKRNV